MRTPDISLFEKYFRKETSPEETQQVEQWIREHNIDVHELELLLTLPEGIRFMLSLDPKKDWHEFRQKLPMQKSRVLYPSLLRVAAVIALFITVGSIFYLLQKPAGNRLIRVANHDAQPKKIMLPDSSYAYLNREAWLQYPEDAEAERTVSMHGEVFFEVKRDVSRPFSINVKECIVQVLGTSFNILSDTSRVTVTVSTGKVAFGQADKKIFLEKGEQGVFDRSTATIGKSLNKETNYLSWKTGVLDFNNTPLTQVIADLEKYFDVSITVSGDAGKAPAYTSHFKNASLSEILDEMQLVLPISYSLKNNKVQLTIKN